MFMLRNSILIVEEIVLSIILIWFIRTLAFSLCWLCELRA